jgi:hypothetical protein
MDVVISSSDNNQHILSAIQMRQQFTGLSGVTCADGCGYHLPVQSDACDKSG